MGYQRFVGVIGGVSLAALLSSAALLLAQDPSAVTATPQDGVEVLARGPVHEAYAGPVDTSRPQATPVVPKQPPAPLDEMPPDQKPAGEGVQWIPGYWGWDDERSDFIWVSGFWRVAPPGRQWMPGHWMAVQ